MDRDTLRQYILESYAAANDFPWISNPTYEVFRHESSKKWFGSRQLKVRSAAFRLSAHRAGLFPSLSHEQGALDKR